MRTIRIGFSKPRGKVFPLFSWAIRLYERTAFSHVYVRWQTKYGFPLCYQASSTMINFMGPSAFDKHLAVVEEFSFDVPDDKWEEFMKFCLESVGKDYAIKGVFGVLIADFFRLKKNPFDRGENRQYCAELVTRLLSHLGMDLNVDADRVKLKQVHEFVRKLAAQRGQK